MKRLHQFILKLRSIRLRQRMFLIYILGGVIPMLFVSTYQNQSTRKILLDHTREAEIVELTLIKESILESMRIVTNVSKHMYFDEGLEYIAFHKYENYEELVQDYRNYTKIVDYRDYYYEDIQGLSVYMENDTISENSRFVKVSDTIRKEKWYQDTLKESGRAVWSFKYDNVQKKIICVYPELFEP